MMRSFCLLFPLCLSLWALPTQARVTVKAQLATDKFLVYEPIRLRLTVRNESAEAVVFGGGSSTARLFFQISTSENKVVPATDLPLFETLWRVEPGETASRDFNLLRLFQIRQVGDYRLTTRVHLPDESLVDQPKLFEVSEGQTLREIKSRKEDRAFRLIQFNRNDRDELLLQVTNHKGTRVLQTYFLGKHLRFYEPEFRKGLDGSIAVLHRMEPEELSFATFRPDGLPLNRRTLNIRMNESVVLEEDAELGFVVRGDSEVKLEDFDADAN